MKNKTKEIALVVGLAEEHWERFNDVEKGLVFDYFMFQTLDIIRNGDREEADEVTSLFEEAERFFTDLKLEKDIWGSEGLLENFFFTLSQLLSLGYEITRFEGEEIDRESFEKHWEWLEDKYHIP